MRDEGGEGGSEEREEEGMPCWPSSAAPAEGTERGGERHHHEECTFLPSLHTPTPTHPSTHTHTPTLPSTLPPTPHLSNMSALSSMGGI